MNEKLYDCLLDIDYETDEISETFTRDPEVRSIVERIVRLSKEEHAEDCDRENCQGHNEYIIKNMKAMLVSHEEYEPGMVMAIIAIVFFNMGVSTANVKSSGDMPDKMREKLESMFGKGNVMVMDAKVEDPEDDGKF